MTCRLFHATANRPGAIAILHLIGDCAPVLREVTGQSSWPLHKVRLVDFAGIDKGLAVRLREDVAQLMPHGGPRVIQKLTAHLLQRGVVLIDDPCSSTVSPRAVYPEAVDELEALALGAVAGAHSSLAIELLLNQPRRWRDFKASGSPLSEDDLARSRRLNRLIDPAMVVLVGAPNVGKSTLSNALMGRSMSIALDMPGTTRDYTIGRIDLGGLVVDWHDTPGLRETDDAIERRSGEIARRLIERADCLIAMTEAGGGWPALGRKPDIAVVNKIDRSVARAEAAGEAGAVRISARTGEGLSSFVSVVRDHLVLPNDLTHAGVWVFDRRLVSEVQAD